MASVHVRVGHHDDLVVAQLLDVEVLGTDPGPQRGDQRAELGRAQHLVEPRALHVQDLAAQRQDRLEPPVARLLRRSARGIALDDEELRARRIAFLAIRQLARQGRDVERALAPGQLARLAGGFPGGRGLDHLGDDPLGLARVLLEPVAQLLADDALDHRANLRRDQLVLGLRGKLGIGHLDREHAGQPLARVLAAQRHLFLLGDAFGARIVVDGPRQRPPEAREMGAAVALRDGVGEAEHGLVVAVRPLQRRLHGDAVGFPADRDGRIEERRLAAVQIFDESPDPAFIGHLDNLGLDPAGVGEHQPDAGVQEGELAQPVFQHRKAEGGVAEGCRGRAEGDLGPRPAPGVAHRLERAGRLSVLEADRMLLGGPPDSELQPFRKRVDHRDADAVKPARDLVGVLVEFPAGMELGHDHLGRRDAFFVHLHRDTAAVIGHGDRAVAVQRDRDLGAMARQRLVDRVVDHLVDHVVQARAVVGVADIHAGPLADRLQPLEDLDRRGVIGVVAGIRRGGFDCLCHRLSRPVTRPERARRRRPRTVARGRPARRTPRARCR